MDKINRIIKFVTREYGVEQEEVKIINRNNKKELDGYIENAELYKNNELKIRAVEELYVLNNEKINKIDINLEFMKKQLGKNNILEMRFSREKRGYFLDMLEGSFIVLDVKNYETKERTVKLFINE